VRTVLRSSLTISLSWRLNQVIHLPLAAASL
jgi:hypothetical protein